MEYSGHGFLEDLVATTIPIEMSDFYTNKWSFNENPFHIPSDYPLEPIDQSLNGSFNEFYFPFGEDPCQFYAPGVTDTPPLPTQEEGSMSMVENEEKGQTENVVQNLEFQSPNCKLEPIQSGEMPVFHMGLGAEKKKRVKKVDGQPSKNLMAERRRRKRLNDRLSMLRSVVPKISKMDRTSILGDTIDYMKELLERINNLQEEIHEVDSSNQFNLMSIFKDVKPNEVLIRNSPKFDVERRSNMDTRIEISCVGKPGLLLSTVSTLEALGLEIQQCVISCFSDFAMQATCSEELEQRVILSSEDVKEALFRNAGYGGRCL